MSQPTIERISLCPKPAIRNWMISSFSMSATKDSMPFSLATGNLA